MKKNLILALLLLTFSCYAKNIKANNNSKTFNTEDFITVWKLPNSNSTLTDIWFGVTTVGIVNYTWRVDDNSVSGSGSIPSGASAAGISLPSGKTIILSISPTNFRAFNTGSSPISYRPMLIDVKQWGTVNWSTMASAFFDCANLNISAIDIPNLNNVSTMDYMFFGCRKLNGPENIGSWNLSNVTSASNMFRSTTLFNKDVSGWNTQNITNMSLMFFFASAFNQNLSGWDFGKVTDMSYMFYQASAFNQNLGGWNLKSTVNLSEMLNGSGIDCNNYSATLNGFSINTAIGNSLNLGATNLQYGQSAVSARNNLTIPVANGGKGWTISGDLASSMPCGSVLPIELGSYAIYTLGRSAKLQWTTLTETNNKEFIISRSIDGKTFTELGKREPVGNHHVYTFFDNSPYIGTSYYRLEQVDLNGKINKIGDKLLNFSFVKQQAIAYPNPTKDVVNFDFDYKIFTTAELFDSTGKKLDTIAIGINQKPASLDLTKLPSGIYFIKLNGKQEEVLKVTKL